MNRKLSSPDHSVSNTKNNKNKTAAKTPSPTQMSPSSLAKLAEGIVANFEKASIIMEKMTSNDFFFSLLSLLFVAFFLSFFELIYFKERMKYLIFTSLTFLARKSNGILGGNLSSCINLNLVKYVDVAKQIFRGISYHFMGLHYKKELYDISKSNQSIFIT